MGAQQVSVSMGLEWQVGTIWEQEKELKFKIALLYERSFYRPLKIKYSERELSNLS